MTTGDKHDHAIFSEDDPFKYECKKDDNEMKTSCDTSKKVLLNINV